MSEFDSFQAQMSNFLEETFRSMRQLVDTEILKLKHNFEERVQEEARQTKTTVDLRATVADNLKTAEIRTDDKIQANAEKLPRFANPHIQLLADIREELQLTSSYTPTDDVMLQEIEDDKESLQALYQRVKQEFNEFLKTGHQSQLIFLPTGYTVKTSKQVKLENVFSKFLGTGTQSSKKFVVLLILSILEYILPKKRIPPDKIFYLMQFYVLFFYFCNYLY